MNKFTHPSKKNIRKDSSCMVSPRSASLLSVQLDRCVTFNTPHVYRTKFQCIYCTLNPRLLWNRSRSFRPQVFSSSTLAGPYERHRSLYEDSYMPLGRGSQERGPPPSRSGLWHAGFHILRGPRPQDVGHLRFGYCFDSKVLGSALYVIVPDTKDLRLEGIKEYFLPPTTVFYVDFGEHSANGSVKAWREIEHYTALWFN
jgi:hypothetical protein